MRIIAGQWRGRSLAAPPGADTRPTADRVREALFSMLVSRLGSLEGLTALDGFAGTGALGLEALSRGAAHCTFVESSPTAARVLATNLRTLGTDARARLVTAPITSLPPAPAPLDLVLLDPPYQQGLAAPALAHLRAGGWLGPATLISLETARMEQPELPGFQTLVDRVHGKARLRLLQPG
jgi:16S rRNA (guanine966-N2)-methyltransferase